MVKKLTERQFYCVKCKARRTIPAEDICTKVYSNKRMYDGKVPTLKAECKCGTSLTKFVKHDAYDKLAAKYGKC